MAFLRRFKPKPCKAPGCTTTHRGHGDYCAAHAHLDDRVTAQPTGEVFGNMDRNHLGHGLYQRGYCKDSIDQDD